MLIKKTRYILSFSIAILIFIFFVLAFNWTLNPEGLEIKSFEVIENEEKFGHNLNAPFDFVLKTPTYVVLKTHIPEKSGESYLYLPQVYTSYLEIFADETLIGTFGFSNKTAHIWYQPLLFKIPEGTNEIKLTIYGIYELGIEFIPYLIDETQKNKYLVLEFLTNKLLLISIGILIALSIILFMLSKNVYNKREKIYLNFFVASLFGAVWLFDLVPFQSMGSVFSMLLLRKTFVASIYLGFAFLLNGSLLNVEKIKPYFEKTLIYIDYFVAILMFFAPTSYHLKLFTNYFSFVLILNSLMFLLLSYRSKIMINILSSTFFFLTVLHDSLSLFLKYNNKFLSSFGIFALFLGISYEIIKEYKFMVREVKVSYEKSLKDKLTDSFNRGVLDLTNFSPDDTFVFVDLDDLKKINDTYGHKKGDEVLVNFVEIVRKNIRSNDLIVRMGGDEFLIVLKNCPIEKAEEIMKKISEFLKKSFDIKVSFSWGISKFKGSLEETIEEIDEKMYEMKGKFKGIK